MENDEIVDGLLCGQRLRHFPGVCGHHAGADHRKEKEEALHLADLFLQMIKGTIKEEDLEELEEAIALQDISHMPARVKCAVLGWHTMEEMLKNRNEAFQQSLLYIIP